MDHVPPQFEHDADDRDGRRTLRRPLAIGFALVAAIGFMALGLWQVERRTWKLALIERVEQRVHAAPVAFTAGMGEADEYRRVALTGAFRHDRETLVQALTERGGGFWVMTPLVGPAGTVLVNRGFVPPDRRSPQGRAAGQAAGAVVVTGLVRRSEPGGGFLRANDPAAGRWYSRDVGAIARTRGLDAVAPVFVDADAAPNPGGWPVGGLTVVRFRNNHQSYALTWFALAAMSVYAVYRLMRNRS